ncbi:hypothetical protein FUA23_04455 [Neolewinella aurantiaca]|uniref:Photosynthesis system II assembly factor Ycf48/Hcf136-like domain-containing protein n=1 Tax=Neolewinella aurantiaca TaxID=2602767 RepID=A0A5C7FVM5_9BACT|nr:hypothetical protein [Neolewinella aurantiaca]TXF90697.1 hypothetical protein FUA23_04455 [Neolewinella aurantiaca]
MYIFSFLLCLTAFAVAPDTTPPADPPNIYRSTDQGESWVPFAEGLPEGAGAGAMLEHNGMVLLGTDIHGFFVLPAGAQRWEARNQGLPKRIDINSIAAKGDLIVIGTYHGRVFTSRDQGLHWNSFVFNFMGGSVRALHFHGDILIAGTDNGIYRSFDYGTTWYQTGDLVQVNSITEFNGRLFAARRDGILASDDDGKSWAFVYSPWTISKLLPTTERLYALGIDGSIMRSKTGQVWEKPIIALPGMNRKNLPAALWGGFKPAPDSKMPVRSITETSVGWFLGVAAGC